MNKLDNNDVIQEIDTLNEKYKKLLKNNRRERMIIIILLMLIIILIFLLTLKLGKIGFEVDISGDINKDDEIPVISIEDNDKDTNINNNDNNSKENNNNENSDNNQSEEIKNDDKENNKGLDIVFYQKGKETEDVSTTSFDIFKNTLFGNRKIIAPGSKGTFEFCVQNNSSYNAGYNLTFIYEITEKINMKYRLKLNGQYIKGNDTNYVKVDEINLKDVSLSQKSTHLYTLEWYWEDDDINDTFIGSLAENQYYKLQIDIVGYQIN